MLIPGDVVVALFTYSDLSGAKIRPALVVSTEAYIKETGLVVLAAISSKPVKNQYEVKLVEWDKAGLRVPSKLCVGKLMTVNLALVKKIGHLTDFDTELIKDLGSKILYFN
ncbi:MAG: type II toxin-antitoxin system PemK/MazF family toxin [Syntrophomonadaceae bacterium]|nr:type II toxin-antitoxin system PemK/MazF family toxin [Syntrophomonadaceae bacterium]MDD3022992.1 type II toxin-antitoxin system PemK/MazF family toxin [Syntrophomonadaceae bacterium]